MNVLFYIAEPTKCYKKIDNKTEWSYRVNVQRGNGVVAILTKFSTLAAPEVGNVIIFVKTAPFPFHYITRCLVLL